MVIVSFICSTSLASVSAADSVALAKNTQKPTCNTIPTRLTEKEFNELVLPNLQVPSCGPSPKLSGHAIFNDILNFMHTGCQWENLAIETGMDGLPEIHYSRIYSKFRYWEATGSLANIFENTVEVLNNKQLLDLSIIHGDGTTTTAKKGGDNLELKGTVMSLDGVYDCKANRKMIFNHGMTPNIPENKRNRKTTKRGRKRVL